MTPQPPRQLQRAVILLGGGTAALLAGLACLGAVMVLLLLGGKQLADQLACDPTSTELTDPSAISAAGRSAIPARFIPIYTAAASRFELGSDGWLWLAAIHQVETGFSTNRATSSAGAEGPMQFMPATWASFGVDADGDGRRDIENDTDAIYGAANYLHASGAPADWHKAVFAYNHAEWYYQRVLRYQRAYRGTTTDPAPDLPTDAQGGGSSAAGAVERRGEVAYALADERGQILTSQHGRQHFPGASLTKTMLLIAALTKHAEDDLGASLRRTLTAMITRSDNTAANTVWSDVGRARVLQVAHAAGMLDFQLRTDDPLYRLGNSLITAEDQARLFAQIDQLMAPAHRAFGTSLLADIVLDQRWGIWNAAPADQLLSKAGWRPEHGGFLITQAAQIRGEQGVRGLAVLTHAPDENYGHQTAELIARELLARSDTTVAAAPGSGCAMDGAIDATGITTTPGAQARLTPQGLAVAPQVAPPEVKALLAAGNRIVGRPYRYGGGHGPPLTTVAESYDCSSSIAYLLFHAGLFTPTTAWVSGAFARDYGNPGLGRWITLRANDTHIYMYVAGLRWDTHRWGAVDRGVPGIGWHTATRPDTGFAARHPHGL